MYTLYWLSMESEAEHWAGDSESYTSIVQEAKALIREMGGILVVRNDEGEIVFEALNDGIEQVTVEKIEMYELRGGIMLTGLGV